MEHLPLAMLALFFLVVVVLALKWRGGRAIRRKGRGFGGSTERLDSFDR